MLGTDIIKTNLEKQIKFETNTSNYNRKRIFKRAWHLVKNKEITLSQALKQVWNESKKVVLKSRKQITYLKNKLTSMFTPKQYIESEAYQVESMKRAYKNGYNLN